MRPLGRHSVLLTSTNAGAERAAQIKMDSYPPFSIADINECWGAANDYAKRDYSRHSVLLTSTNAGRIGGIRLSVRVPAIQYC